jgi:hypothetical protein
MKITTHNSQIAVRRLEKLKVCFTGRRAWSPYFQ